MPTSSQALILSTEPGGQPTESLFRTQSQQLKEPAPYAIASVVDLSGCLRSSTNAVDDCSAVKLLGKDSAQLFKYHKLPTGYTSILAYDSSSDSFKWQVLRCADTKQSNTSVRVDLEPEHEDEGKSSPVITASKRPSSSMEEFKRNDTGQIKVNSRSMYDHLIELGFRKSDLVVKNTDSKAFKEAWSEAPKTGSGKKQTGRKPASVRKTSVVKVPAIEAERPDDIAAPTCTPVTSPTESIEPYTEIRYSSAKKVVINETESFSDVTSDEPDIEDIDGYCRIKPSIFMVKHTPKSRPTAAILSLRENECSFHAEVKFFIETQTHVSVKSIQYDPLHIRSGKPDVRSRWIVDFHNVDDLEKVVKTGLVVGKDKIIVYKYDEIMRREVSAFKYFRAVLEAKRRLKGAKSNVESVKTTPSTTGKSKRKTIRSIKSAH